MGAAIRSLSGEFGRESAICWSTIDIEIAHGAKRSSAPCVVGSLKLGRCPVRSVRCDSTMERQVPPVGDVLVRFDGSGVVPAGIACAALQPVLDSVYHRCWGEPLPIVEKALRYAGRGAFSRDGIEIFAGYISAGDRPVLTSGNVDVDRARFGTRSSL